VAIAATAAAEVLCAARIACFTDSTHVPQSRPAPVDRHTPARVRAPWSTAALTALSLTT
jgi:hypothetical protein